MIDTLVHNLDRASHERVTGRLGVTPGNYLVATFHRPANVDGRDALERLLAILTRVASRTRLVLPLHPRTRASLERHGLVDRLDGIEGLTVCEPLGYLDFIGLIRASRGVVTDSGGIQEETTFLQIPCLTLRTSTERPVTVDVGSNELIGENLDRLYSAVDEIIAGSFKHGAVPELWDGEAAARIVAVLGDALGEDRNARAGESGR